MRALMFSLPDSGPIINLWSLIFVICRFVVDLTYQFSQFEAWQLFGFSDLGYQTFGLVPIVDKPKLQTNSKSWIHFC